MKKNKFLKFFLLVSILSFVSLSFVNISYAQIGPSIIGSDEWGVDKDGNPVYIGPAATTGVTTFGIPGTIGGGTGSVGIVGASGTASSGSSFGNCPSEISDISSLVVWVICFIMKALVPLAFALALVLFIWGVIKYVINADNEAKRKEGGKFILWGIVALFVMLSVWGLVAVLSNTFNLDTAIPQLPIAPTTTY